MLYNRTSALSSANFDKARKVEKSIEDFIGKNYDNVVTPTRAFVIFESEHTKDYITKVDENTIRFDNDSVFSECKLKFKKAVDPTIVIHEDTDGSRCRKKTSRILVYLGLIIAGWFYLQALIWVSQISIELIYIRSPPGIDCDQFVKTGLREGQVLAYYQFLDHAKSYETGMLKSMFSQMNTRVSKEGYLQCFCQEQKATVEGWTLDKLYEGPTKDYPPKPICEMISTWNGLISTVISSSVNYIIVLMNLVMRGTFMALARKMSFKNKSQKYNFIMKSVFVALFFQTGLLVLFAFLDARSLNNSVLASKLFGGLYTDFNQDWFNDAGVFLITTYKV